MFIEFAFGDAQEKWKEASPQFLTPEDRSSLPPWLLIHAPGDTLVSPVQSERFKEHLEALSVPVELCQDVKGDHYHAVANIGSADSKVTDLVMHFIHKTLETTKH